MIILQIATRLLAFIGKELVEVVRRPGAIVSLVVGPFLIMAIFGVGYSGFKRPLATVIVVPPNSGLPTDVSAYEGVDAPGFQIVGVTPDRSSAESMLRDREIDLVVVAPDDVATAFQEGRQSEIAVEYNLVDPVQAAYTDFLAERLEAEVNREIIERAAAEGQAYAIQAGETLAAQIPPLVVASPTEATSINIAPTKPNVVAFFGPAVLALILQHMAISLVAISLVRERSSGIIEVFRVAPVAAWEVVLGKLLAFGVLNAAIASLTVVLLVNLLRVPMLGDAALLAGVLSLLVMGSIGIGMVVALISDSERQAVQVALLVLLASVFFSGLVLPINEFIEPVRAAAYGLPVTHGIRLAQDIMLRGATNAGWEIGILAAIAGISLLLAWLLLRRAMSRA
jgi:ABC-2 type transport system permease protein